MRDIGLSRGFLAAMGVGLLLGAPWATAADPACTPVVVPRNEALTALSPDDASTNPAEDDRIVISSDVADLEVSGDAELSLSLIHI